MIGSGAVGLYTARELARRGHPVMVVESGGVGLDGFGTETYRSIGRSHDGIRIGRSRSLGGTTNLWGGQLVEFQPVDLGGRSWMADSRWPLSFDELRPYYARTYENLGIPREAQDDRPVFDHFLGSSPRFEEGLEPFLTRWLKIPSLSVAYDREIRTSERLQVLLDHTAVGFVGSQGVIDGLRVADRAGTVHVLPGGRFILANGTIEISRLLIHATRAPDWDCPWRDNPHLGLGFQDHLGGVVASVHAHDRRRFFDMFCTMIRGGHKYQPKLRLTNETLEQLPILGSQGMFSFESSVSENLVYLKQFLKAAIYSRRVTGIGDLGRNLAGAGKYLVPLMWRYVVDRRIFVPGASKISLVIQSEQLPRTNSRIGVDLDARDRFGLPRAVLDWRVGAEELSSIREFVMRCDRALRAAGVARLEIPQDLIQEEPRFLDTLRDTNHPSGGARMGSSERDGVVDRNLRIFGTRNLYVAGAATFRTNSNANTTFTAMTLATRLIDHLESGHADD